MSDFSSEVLCMCKNIGQPTHQLNAEKVETSKNKFKRQLRIELEVTGVPAKAVYDEAGLDKGAFSRICNDESQDALHAHHLPAVTRELGPGLMIWLAKQCGGTYIHGGSARLPEGDPMALVGLLAKSCGQTVQEILQDMADMKWDAAERTARIAGLRKILSVGEALLHEAERAA